MEKCLEKGTEDVIIKFADEISLYNRSLGNLKLNIVKYNLIYFNF